VKWSEVIGICHSCSFEDIEIREYSKSFSGSPERTKTWLCEICAKTLLSRAHLYPSLAYPAWVSGIAYCANAIIQEIRKLKEEKNAG